MQPPDREYALPAGVTIVRLSPPPVAPCGTMNAQPFLRRLREDFLHLIAPALCPGCDEPLGPEEREYCRTCRTSLEPAPYPREILAEIATHFPPEELALEAIGALYNYAPESGARNLVHALKYQGCYGLGVAMGGELGRAMRMFTAFDDVEIVAPVTLHRAKMRERGYNQAQAIAEGMVKTMHGTRMAHLLERTRHTTSQTLLDAAGRRRNVREAFRRTAFNLEGACVLLCDDVCTTGATLNACAELLLASGARRVVAATLAKDPLSAASPDIHALIPAAVGG